MRKRLLVASLTAGLWASFMSVDSIAAEAGVPQYIYSPTKDAGMVFAPRQFYVGSPMAPGYGDIDVSGRLAGPGVLYENNTVDLSCYQPTGQCTVSMIEQDGPNQLSRLDAPETLSIVTWVEGAVVVATEEQAPPVCIQATVTINVASKTVAWVHTPINRDQPVCKGMDPNPFVWTIEKSLFWPGKQN